MNHADGNHFPATVFSISGGSSRTASQAMDRTGCCSLCDPECSRRSSTARREEAAEMFGIQPDLIKDSILLFGRLFSFHIGVCCSVYDCRRNRQKEVGQKQVGIDK